MIIADRSTARTGHLRMPLIFIKEFSDSRVFFKKGDHMAEKRRPRAGEIWTGHGGIAYIVITPAEHFVTGDDLVVYRAQDGDGPAYVCTLEAFQEFMRPAENDGGTYGGAARAKEASSDDGEAFSEEDFLQAFFAAGSPAKQIEIINENWNDITDRVIDNIGIVMDMPIRQGTTSERLIELTGCLRMKGRYEGGRERLRGD